MTVDKVFRNGQIILEKTIPGPAIKLWWGIPNYNNARFISTISGYFIKIKISKIIDQLTDFFKKSQCFGCCYYT